MSEIEPNPGLANHVRRPSFSSSLLTVTIRFDTAGRRRYPRTPTHGPTGTRRTRMSAGSKATEGNNLVRNRSVLVVNRSEETREVLTTALERRGWRGLGGRPGPTRAGAGPAAPARA